MRLRTPSQPGGTVKVIWDSPGASRREHWPSVSFLGRCGLKLEITVLPRSDGKSGPVRAAKRAALSDCRTSPIAPGPPARPPDDTYLLFFIKYYFYSF